MKILFFNIFFFLEMSLEMGVSVFFSFIVVFIEFDRFATVFKSLSFNGHLPPLYKGTLNSRDTEGRIVFNIGAMSSEKFCCLDCAMQQSFKRYTGLKCREPSPLYTKQIILTPLNICYVLHIYSIQSTNIFIYLVCADSRVFSSR